jgi:hypothetical protein
MTRLYARSPFLSSGGVGPWKNTAPGKRWIQSVPVLSLPKGSRPPQTLHLSPFSGQKGYCWFARIPKVCSSLIGSTVLSAPASGGIVEKSLAIDEALRW